MNPLRRGRERALAANADGPLADYYRDADPAHAWRRTKFDDASFLVLDIETTGLDVRRDHILSLGWLHIERRRMPAASARHAVVRVGDDADVGVSAVLHGITDSMVESGEQPEAVLGELLGDLAERVLVCHYAQVEIGFLSRVCRRLWGADLRPRALIDTMQLHVDHARREGTTIVGDDVRLYRLLERYGLPRVRPHDALSDAYGTALLLLAMRARGPSDLGSYLDRRSW